MSVAHTSIVLASKAGLEAKATRSVGRKSA